MDKNIKLFVEIEGKKIESSSIVSLLEQMEYNQWNDFSMMVLGNLKLRLKRITKDDESK